MKFPNRLGVASQPWRALPDVGCVVQAIAECAPMAGVDAKQSAGSAVQVSEERRQEMAEVSRKGAGPDQETEAAL